MSLTAKQEAFAQAVAGGLNQSDAYRSAYPKALAWQDATVWVKASHMAALDKVKTRVDQLRKEVADLNLWTRADSVRVLSEVADGDKGGERVSAVKELNAMHGFNAPVKLDVAGSVSINVNFD